MIVNKMWSFGCFSSTRLLCSHGRFTSESARNFKLRGGSALAYGNVSRTISPPTGSCLYLCQATSVVCIRTFLTNSNTRHAARQPVGLQEIVVVPVVPKYELAAGRVWDEGLSQTVQAMPLLVRPATWLMFRYGGAGRGRRNVCGQERGKGVFFVNIVGIDRVEWGNHIVHMVYSKVNNQSTSTRLVSFTVWHSR